MFPKVRSFALYLSNGDAVDRGDGGPAIPAPDSR
jgi:hypothetical protein